MTPVGARSRGVALILVLWWLVLMATIVGAFALSASSGLLQARALQQDLIADQVARAGVEYAVSRINDPDPNIRWKPDRALHEWAFGDATLTIKVADEGAKIGLNTADVSTIAALFQTLGVEAGVAARVAAAIVDWRDPDPLTQPGGGAEDPDYASAGLPWARKLCSSPLSDQPFSGKCTRSFR